jgi:dimethylhistidine N-methyltransferase
MTALQHPPLLRASNTEFLRDVVRGLSQSPRSLPCKYFYDERGSALFDAICELPEYYPTRTERAILQRHAAAMIERLGEDPVLIEYGSGSSDKTRLLLDALPRGTYVPVDISREHLLRTARRLATAYPHLEILPVVADFTRPFAIPKPQATGRRVVYFSGSTIGNFLPDEALKLLRQIGELIGQGGGLLIGVDLKKDKAILEPAYNDRSGVTAAFNLNLLERINRELLADFDVENFRHRAWYNEALGRIEMHLVSQADQSVRIAGRRFQFRRGETICTEYSHKYSLDDFAQLARRANLTIREVWCDEHALFSVQYAQRC